MVSVEDTALTPRQAEVLELREQGLTQREIADRWDTTDANVSAVERAAERNVERARRTLDAVRALRSPVRFTADAGTSFDALVAEVYERADAAGIRVAYCRPELFGHLFDHLGPHAEDNRLAVAVRIAVTADGQVHTVIEGQPHDD